MAKALIWCLQLNKDQFNIGLFCLSFLLGTSGMLRGIISAMSFTSNLVRFCHLETGEITDPQSNLVSRSQNGFVFVVSRPESCLLHVGKPVLASTTQGGAECTPQAPGAPESKMRQEG